jgi:hypothetical protein
MSETFPDPTGRPDDRAYDAGESAHTRVTPDGIREVGFDDPELRPLPPDKLHYHVPHRDAHPELHEHSDVPIRPLVVALVGLAVMCVVTLLLCYFVFWDFKGRQEARELPHTAVPAARPDVPEPRLQGVPGFSDNHPKQDLVQMREHYAAELGSYGRSDDGAAARIPIDRAMDLAMERKIFPVRAPGAGSAPATAPATAPARKGGGR